MIRTDELVGALYRAGFKDWEMELLNEEPGRDVIGIYLKHPECAVCVGQSLWGEDWDQVQLQVGDGSGDDHRNFTTIKDCIATIRQLLRDETAAKELGDFERAEVGFSSFQDWVDKAVTRMRPGDICVDSKGRRLNIGGDFMRARDEDAFPVDIYRPLKD